MELDTTCRVCHQPFTTEQWSKRQDMHASDCALYKPWPENGPCVCDDVAHEECNRQDPKELFAYAQVIEERCDGGWYGSDNYAPADDAWDAAFDAAQRMYGAQEFEDLMQQYCWSTPVQREASRFRS